MSAILVEKNIPIRSCGRKRWKYNFPWADMKIGDSIFVPRATFADASVDQADFTNRVNNCTQYQQRKDGNLYRWRTEDEGVRIWRVA